jgi:hypothetical protein
MSGIPAEIPLTNQGTALKRRGGGYLCDAAPKHRVNASGPVSMAHGKVVRRRVVGLVVSFFGTVGLRLRAVRRGGMCASDQRSQRRPYTEVRPRPGEYKGSWRETGKA